MFKKKPELPPRPKIPTVEQIIEDIEHSSPDDIVFQSSCIGEIKQESASQPSDADALYCKVKELENMVRNSMFNMIQKLQDQNEALKISDLELKAMAEDIRKQALDALQ